MITRIKAENFKCFKQLDIPLKNLTVLAGLNGSGKSSVIQALVYMRQCVKRSEKGVSSVSLRDQGLHFVNADDIYYQFSPAVQGQVRVGAETGGGEAGEALCYVVNANPGTLSLEKIEVAEVNNRVPSSSMLTSFRNVKRLVSNRLGPTDAHDYLESEVRAKNIGEMGENAVAYLLAYGDEPVLPQLLRKDKYNRDSLSLLPQVGTWLRKVSPGVSLFIDSAGKTDTHVPLYFKYGSGPSSKKFRPTNVGAGLSISLPVLVLLLSAKEGDCLIIEDPESDLHPKGQAELARLIANAAQAGVQIILETHSDHIVNGIRVAVKKGDISSDKVNIAFFRKVIEAEGSAEEEQYSNCEIIELDRNGTLSSYPADFMEEWGVLLDQLLEDDVLCGEGESSDYDGVSE